MNLCCAFVLKQLTRRHVVDGEVKEQFADRRTPRAGRR